MREDFPALLPEQEAIRKVVYAALDAASRAMKLTLSGVLLAVNGFPSCNSSLAVSSCRARRRERPHVRPCHASDMHGIRSFLPAFRTQNMAKKTRKISGRGHFCQAVAFQKSLLPVTTHCAGLDIHKDLIWACAGPFEDGCTPEVRTFPTHTSGLEALAAYLRERQVETVAMESTGVYWLACFELLRDRGLSPMLVNAQHVKGIRGRPKTDRQDCIWLCRLCMYGFLTPSFVPSDEILILREHIKLRQDLLLDYTRYLHRCLDEMVKMNCRLDTLVSDLAGMSAQRVIRAVLSGVHNPHKLVALLDPSIQKRHKAEDMLNALSGNFAPRHLLILEEWLCEMDYLHQRLEVVCKKIASLLKALPKAAVIQPLPPRHDHKHYKENLFFDEPLRPIFNDIFGMDLTQLPGVGCGLLLTFVGVVGTDLSAWPSSGQFASWLGLTPVNQISAGRCRSSKTKRVKNRLTQTLKTAVMSLQRTKTMLGENYRRLNRRMTGAKTRTAIARKLAIILYDCLTGKTTPEAYDEDRQSHVLKERRIKSMSRQLHKWGYDVSPRKTA